MAEVEIEDGVSETPSLRDTIIAARDAQIKEAEPDQEADAEPEAKAKPERPAKQAKEASQEAREAPEERPRGPDGKFAPKIASEAPKAAEAEAEPAKEAVKDVAPTDIRPPPGWSPASKVAFANLPDSVKTDIAKRESEVNQGFAKLADYKGLEPFTELAKRNGTTITEAVKNYNAFENSLNKDLVGGVGMICERYGQHPLAIANEIIRRYGGTPAQIGSAGNQAPAQNGIDLSPIQRELAELRSYMQNDQQTRLDQTIEQFKSDPAHTFFDNVRPQMAALLESGFAKDLKEAYDAACWANPEIRDLLIKQQSSGNGQAAQVASNAAAATQARRAAKAVTGAPSPGFKEAPKEGQRMSIRDNIRAAIDRQVGRA